MAGGKQTPRARMINILYLVLLGLIALEAPANLLDAFKKIGDSLVTSIKNVQTGIDQNYKSFDKKVQDEPERAKPILAKAKAATAISEELNTFVDSLKTILVQRTGGLNPKKTDYQGRENVDEGNRLMITDEKATELKNKINATRTKLISMLDPQDQSTVSLATSAEDPEGADKSWEQTYFGDGVPMGAEMTTFIKIQSDIKNDEAQIQKKLLSKMEQAVVTLDQFQGVAVAPSSYIIAGQPYVAQIFLTAYDSHSNPEITIDGQRIPTSQGKGTYTVNTSSEGIKTYTGKISVKGTDGKVKVYDLPKQTYQVSKPSAVVSPDKMNVLYIGVENPLSVSSPGIGPEKLHISMSGGTFTGSNGHYMAKVTSTGDVKVTISGEVEKGKTATLGSYNFRVKRIPPPIAQFAGKSSGSSPAVNLRAQERVFAFLTDFPFDLKYTVSRFTLYIAKPRQDVVPMKGTGPDLNAQMKAAMQGITPGTKIIFDDIVANGPDGTPVNLSPIVLTAN